MAVAALSPALDVAGEAAGATARIGWGPSVGGAVEGACTGGGGLW